MLKMEEEDSKGDKKTERQVKGSRRDITQHCENKLVPRSHTPHLSSSQATNFKRPVFRNRTLRP